MFVPYKLYEYIVTSYCIALEELGRKKEHILNFVPVVSTYGLFVMSFFVTTKSVHPSDTCYFCVSNIWGYLTRVLIFKILIFL